LANDVSAAGEKRTIARACFFLNKALKIHKKKKGHREAMECLSLRQLSLRIAADEAAAEADGDIETGKPERRIRLQLPFPWQEQSKITRRSQQGTCGERSKGGGTR
jgi:hypothetical protein